MMNPLNLPVLSTQIEGMRVDIRIMPSEFDPVYENMTVSIQVILQAPQPFQIFTACKLVFAHSKEFADYYARKVLEEYRKEMFGLAHPRITGSSLPNGAPHLPQSD